MTIDGKLAALSAALPAQLSIQVPVDAAVGQVQMIVDVQGRRSAPVSLMLDTHAPGIVTTDAARTTASIIKTSGQIVTAQNPAIPGEALTLFGAIGLGPTNPAVPTGSAPSGVATTVTQPTLTIASQPVQIQGPFAAPGSVGTYQINFTVPNLAEGTHPLFLEIGGKRSNTVNLTVGRPPLTVSRVVNGATFGSEGMAAPGSFLSVFGTNIAPRENLAAFPATTLDGLTVTIGNIAAPLFHVIPANGQINLLVPSELPETGNVSLRVRTTAGTSLDVPVRMLDADPGIFRVDIPSTPPKDFAAALLPNTRWLPLPESAARLLQLPVNCQADGVSPLSFCAQPVRRGDTLQVFTTGLGRATPGGDPGGRPLATGALAPADGNPLYLSVQRPTATVGGVPAEVSFAGIAPGFTGLYQVNLRIPDAAPAGDEVPLRITMPNGRSDTLPIAIR